MFYAKKQTKIQEMCWVFLPDEIRLFSLGSVNFGCNLSNMQINFALGIFIVFLSTVNAFTGPVLDTTKCVDMSIT